MTLQTLIMFIQAAGIIVAVIYHVMTLRNTRKNQQLQLETRQAQLIMQLWDTYIEKYRESYIVWRDLEYEDFQDFWNKYGKDKNPDF